MMVDAMGQIFEWSMTIPGVLAGLFLSALALDALVVSFVLPWN